MTHTGAKKKRKHTSSGTSPVAPQAPVRDGNTDPVGFSNALLQSLKVAGVREELLAIVTDAFSQQLRVLENRAAQDRAKIAALESELRQEKLERKRVEEDLHELRQYTRRNALRIVNPSWPEPRQPRQRDAEPEDTDALVLELAENLGVNLAPWEIGRSYRVGRRRTDGTPRPIIVKFISYNARRRMYNARKKLRDTSALAGVYINEDLTPENNKLAYEARQLKNQRRLADTFTRDGLVFAKRFQDDRPKRVKDLAELNNIARTFSATTIGEAEAAANGGVATVATGGAAAATTADDVARPPQAQAMEAEAVPHNTAAAESIGPVPSTSLLTFVTPLGLLPVHMDIPPGGESVPAQLPGAAEELEGGPGGGQMPEDAQEED